MSKKPEGLTYFEKELAKIEDASLNAFFYNAIANAPESFHNDTASMAEAKTAFHILAHNLDKKDVQGAARDALLGTVLICDLMVNEFDESMKALHTVAVRPYLIAKGINKDLHVPLWENIMRVVESHEGLEGASPILEARPGTAEFDVFQAFEVARIGFLTLDWEEIYNEGESKE